MFCFDFHKICLENICPNPSLREKKSNLSLHHLFVIHRARQRKRQLQGNRPGGENAAKKDDDDQPPHLSGGMEVEETGAAGGVPGGPAQTGDSDGQVSDGQVSDAAESVEGEEGEDSGSDSGASFSAKLEQELKRQKKSREQQSGVGECDVDVLQIEAEDDDIID